MKQKLFLLALAISGLSVLNAQDFAGTQVLNGASNMSLDLKLYPAGDSVQIIISGPSNVWHGVGFGGNVMANTYAIIIDGAGVVSERTMGNQAAGTSIASSITKSSNTVSGMIRTTTITRAMMGMTASHFTFANAASSIPLIWGFGTGSSLAFHANRGATAIQLVSTIGIAENEINNVIDVFPSPTTGEVTLDLGTPYQSISAEIYSVNGQLIAVESFESASEITLNIEGVEGLYIVKVTADDDYSASARILKK